MVQDIITNAVKLKITSIIDMYIIGHIFEDDFEGMAEYILDKAKKTSDGDIVSQIEDDVTFITDAKELFTESLSKVSEFPDKVLNILIKSVETDLFNAVDMYILGSIYHDDFDSLSKAIFNIAKKKNNTQMISAFGKVRDRTVTVREQRDTSKLFKKAIDRNRTTNIEEDDEIYDDRESLYQISLIQNNSSVVRGVKDDGIVVELEDDDNIYHLIKCIDSERYFTDDNKVISVLYYEDGNCLLFDGEDFSEAFDKDKLDDEIEKYIIVK